MLLDVASQAELKALDKFWQQVELAAKIAMKWAQLSDNVKTLMFIQENVKMTKKITLEQLETRQVLCISKYSIHRKG